ncbi:unnamed protein product, partial [marine sediment metagenome]
MLVPKRKLTMLAMLALIIMGVPMTLAGLSRIWNREITGTVFYFEYIDFEGFISTTWGSYAEQTEVLELDSQWKTMITVTQTDYDPGLLLDISYTSSAEGAVITATGRYVSLYWADTSEHINNEGDPFNIPTDGTTLAIDTAQMIWEHPFG